MPLAVLLSPHFVPACFVVFVGLRLLSVICLDTTPTSDAAWYFERAVGLANGAGYSEGGLPTAFWPIGYPGILSALFALFGSKVIVGQLANVVFGAASFVGVYHLANASRKRKQSPALPYSR